jgi:excisionase family DNA binding protein
VSYLTIEQVTEKLNIHQKTLYNWRKNEGLPYIKVGKTIYIKEESLNKWMTEREKQETQA